MTKALIFSRETRSEQIGQLSDQEFDLAIIGGGVSGAACARDAALRGFKTLLVEASDFASATSSGSSKLIHGGVRYLKNYEFGLVYTAIRERERLEHLYAPFVQKIPFVFPTYKGREPNRRLLDLGLTLYDAFAFFREIHKCWGARKTKAEFPLLKDDKLTGCVVYADSFAEDYRLVIEMIKSAHRNGAMCLSRLRAEEIRENSGSFELSLKDELTGRSCRTRAKKVVNCAGPFSDNIKKQLNLPPRLHLTQGVHFIVPREALPVDQAYVLSDPENDRILFAVPWKSITFLGTTDTSISSMNEAKARAIDLHYVLEVCNRYFKTQLKSSDVIQSWTAVRPLIQPEAAESNSKISREHLIEEKPTGFFHLLGGKLTSHREMAEEIIDQVATSLGSSEACKTRKQPLQGKKWTGPDRPSHLDLSFGFDADLIREMDQNRGLQRQQVSKDFPNLVSEVIFACHYEMVISPIDYMRRRSSLYYEAPRIEIIEALASIIRKELNWSDQEMDHWMKTSLKELTADTASFVNEQAAS